MTNPPDERGATGFATAIILVTFAAVSTVFAFFVFFTGMIDLRRGQVTVYAGLHASSSALELRGSVIATSSTPSHVDTIQFQLAHTRTGGPVSLDRSAGPAAVLSYRDERVVLENVPYSVTSIIGNGDAVLDDGEVMLVTVNVADLQGSVLAPSTRFTLRVQTPEGDMLDITRSVPSPITGIMQLH